MEKDSSTHLFIVSLMAKALINHLIIKMLQKNENFNKTNNQHITYRNIYYYVWTGK